MARRYSRTRCYLIPDPVLVGRNEKKLSRLAHDHHVDAYTTDLDVALSDNENRIFFDSTKTELRVDGVTRAIEAGKAVYSRSLLQQISKMRWNSTGQRIAPVSNTGWSRTNSGCRGF